MAAETKNVAVVSKDILSRGLVLESIPIRLKAVEQKAKDSESTVATGKTEKNALQELTFVTPVQGHVICDESFVARIDLDAIRTEHMSNLFKDGCTCRFNTIFDADS